MLEAIQLIGAVMAIVGIPYLWVLLVQRQNETPKFQPVASPAPSTVTYVSPELPAPPAPAAPTPPPPTPIQRRPNDSRMKELEGQMKELEEKKQWLSEENERLRGTVEATTMEVTRLRDENARFRSNQQPPALSAILSAADIDFVRNLMEKTGKQGSETEPERLTMWRSE